MKKLIMLAAAGAVIAVISFGAGVYAGPAVSKYVVSAMSESRYIGCEPVKDYEDRMLCDIHVVSGPEVRELIVQLRTSPDAAKEPDEVGVSIGCREWKPAMRWFLGPVHDCGVAAG